MKRTPGYIVKGFPMMEPEMKPKDKNAAMEDLQVAMSRAVFNTDHAETCTMKDCGNHIRELARERGLENNDTVQAALKDMEFIGREIAAARSGASGERAVEKALRYVERKKVTLPNVILSEGDDKTELDQIVLTSNGILILEVKNYKSDVTIAETGLVYGVNRKRCSDKSLGDQMNLKRYLLRTKMERELGEHNIPVHIESRVVFSNPSIEVADHYGLEKYCFTAKLPQEIERFTSDVEYSPEEMKILATVIQSIAEDESVYDIGFDYDRIKETFANALVLLETESPSEEAPSCEVPNDSTLFADDSFSELQSQIERSNRNLRKYKTATVISMTALVGVLGIGIVDKFINRR